MPNFSLPLLHPTDPATVAATNLLANTFSAVSDPNLRLMVSLRSSVPWQWARLQGRLGGTLVTATKVRVQYHLGGDPAIATGDAGWKTLLDSAGTHVLNTMFVTSPVAIPEEAKISSLLLRVGLFGGDGVADPTLTCAILSVYE